MDLSWLPMAVSCLLFPAGIWTGLWLAKVNLDSKVTLAETMSRTMLRDEQATQELKTSNSRSEATLKALESLTQTVDRMDLSIGRFADILVQRGLARVASRDLQVGEGEGLSPRSPTRRSEWDEREQAT